MTTLACAGQAPPNRTVPTATRRANICLDTRQYSTLTLPACLISHFLPLPSPFNPQIEAAKVQQMATPPNGRGTLRSPAMLITLVNKHGQYG